MASFIAWPLVVLGALVGWGLLGARVATAIGRVELRTAGLVLPLGVALYIALAGLAVAVDRYGRVFVGLFVAVGVAAAIIEAGRWIRHPHRAPGWWAPPLIVGALLTGAALVLAFSTTAHFYWNPCDDDVAYLYLAQRLLLEGDLLDPLSFRRLTSLGGMSTLQALFLVRLPDSFLPLADAFVGSLLILVGLWRTRAAKWSGWGIAAASVVTLVPSTLGAVNTSPILIPVGLVVAAFAASAKLRAEATTRNAEMVSSFIVGLFVGSAASLRPQFGFPLALFAIAAVSWPPLGSCTAYRLGGVALGATASLCGLAIASWRAVGTPMFPILGGNVDQSWLAKGPQTEDPSVLALLGRVAETRGAWACVLALLLGLFVVAFLRSESDEDRAYAHWNIRLLIVATVASILWLTFVVRIWWGLGETSNYARFWAPVVLASVLLPIVLINGSGGRNTWPTRVWGLAAFTLVAFTLHAGPKDVGRNAIDVVLGSGSGYVTELLSADRYANQRGYYARAASLVPSGSKVLTAVDVPSLLLKRGFDVHTLDLVGSTSPPPHLPYFRGTHVKLSWLRRHGYDYIVAIDPDTSACLYSRSEHQQNLEEEGGLNAAWAAYDFDWFRFLDEISGIPGMRSAEVGPLVVVKVR